MDPLSATASIVGIAGFGIKLAQILQQQVEAISTAAERVEQIAIEIRATASGLKELQRLLREDAGSSANRVFNDGGRMEINAIVWRCNTVFRNLTILLAKAGDGALSAVDRYQRQVEEEHKRSQRTENFEAKLEIELSNLDHLMWPWRLPKIQQHIADLDRLKISLVLILSVATLAKKRKNKQTNARNTHDDSSSNDWDASEDETLVEDEIFNQDIELREAENQFEALTAQHSSLGRPPQHGRSAAGLLLQTWPNSPSGDGMSSVTDLYEAGVLVEAFAINPTTTEIVDMPLNMQTIQSHALRKPKWRARKSTQPWDRFARLPNEQQEMLLEFMTERGRTVDGLDGRAANDVSSSIVVLISIHKLHYRMRNAWEVLKRSISFDTKYTSSRSTLFIVIGRLPEPRRYGPEPLPWTTGPYGYPSYRPGSYVDPVIYGGPRPRGDHSRYASQHQGHQQVYVLDENGLVVPADTLAPGPHRHQTFVDIDNELSRSRRRHHHDDYHSPDEWDERSPQSRSHEPHRSRSHGRHDVRIPSPTVDYIPERRSQLIREADEAARQRAERKSLQTEKEENGLRKTDDQRKLRSANKTRNGGDHNAVGVEGPAADVEAAPRNDIAPPPRRTTTFQTEDDPNPGPKSKTQGVLSALGLRSRLNRKLASVPPSEYGQMPHQYHSHLLRSRHDHEQINPLNSGYVAPSRHWSGQPAGLTGSQHRHHDIGAGYDDTANYTYNSAPLRSRHRPLIRTYTADGMPPTTDKAAVAEYYLSKWTTVSGRDGREWRHGTNGSVGRGGEDIIHRRDSREQIRPRKPKQDGSYDEDELVFGKSSTFQSADRHRSRAQRRKSSHTSLYSRYSNHGPESRLIEYGHDPSSNVPEIQQPRVDNSHARYPNYYPQRPLDRGEGGEDKAKLTSHRDVPGISSARQPRTQPPSEWTSAVESMYHSASDNRRGQPQVFELPDEWQEETYTRQGLDQDARVGVPTVDRRAYAESISDDESRSRRRHRRSWSLVSDDENQGHRRRHRRRNPSGSRSRSRSGSQSGRMSRSRSRSGWRASVDERSKTSVEDEERRRRKEEKRERRRKFSVMLMID